MTHDLNGQTRRDDEPAREPWFLHQPVEPQWGDLPTYELPPVIDTARNPGPLRIGAIILAAVAAGYGLAFLASIWS